MRAIAKREEDEKSKTKTKQQQVRVRQQPKIQVMQEVVTKERVIKPKLDNSLHKVKTGKVTKRRSETVAAKIPKTGVDKFKISVSQVCRFLKMKDYPVPVTDQSRDFFQEYNNFENYYLPLLASVNPTCDPLKIKTLSKAKWREIISSDAQPSSSLYFNHPRNNTIKLNIIQ